MRFVTLVERNMHSLALASLTWADAYLELTFKEEQDCRKLYTQRVSELAVLHTNNHRVLRLFKGVYGIRLLKVAKKETRKQFEERLITEMLKELGNEPLSNLLSYAANYLHGKHTPLMCDSDEKIATVIDQYVKLLDTRIREVRE